MKLWRFDQNNTGGLFTGPCHDLIVEADTPDEANKIAEKFIYFDGCDNGRDCECCGDRWHRQWECSKPEKTVKSFKEYLNGDAREQWTRYDNCWHRQGVEGKRYPYIMLVRKSGKIERYVYLPGGKPVRREEYENE